MQKGLMAQALIASGRPLDGLRRGLPASDSVTSNPSLSATKKPPTLSKLIETWVASYERTYSPRHLESVKGFAKRWINPALGDLPVDRIFTQRVLDLRAEMLNQGRSQASANLMLRILKLLMSYAIRLGHIQKRPFSVAPLRIQRKPRPVVPASMVKRFLEEAGQVSKDPHQPLL